MAEIISEVLGTQVRFQQITFEAYKDRFIGFGMSDAMAQGMTDMAWAKNEGLDNAVQRTPGNSTPTSFRQWCEDVLKPAVIDQAVGHRVGFWNPSIYRWAAGPHSPFHPLDKASAGNTNLFYTGTPGHVFNPASGLGTPNLALLARDFARS